MKPRILKVDPQNKDHEILKQASGVIHNRGLVAFLRSPESPEDTPALVLINLNEQGGELWVPFSVGTWQEQIVPENQEIIEVNSPGEYKVYIPSNYGKIFTLV